MSEHFERQNSYVHDGFHWHQWDYSHDWTVLLGQDQNKKEELRHVQKGLSDVNSDCLTSATCCLPCEVITCGEPRGYILPFNWLKDLTTGLRFIKQTHREKGQKGKNFIWIKLLTSLPWSHQSVLEKEVCCGGLSGECSHLQWRSQWPTDRAVYNSIGKYNWKNTKAKKLAFGPE